MFDRISHTWQIMGKCFEVLKKDKELLFFPIFSTGALILLMASWATPLFASESFMRSTLGGPGQDLTPLGYLYLFLFYYLNSFIIIFFNTGVVSCALERLQGGDPTISSGMQAAARRLPLIAGWALVAGTVGFVLKLIEERAGWLGQIIVGLLGALWTLVTFFAIPVLVAEQRSPIDTLKTSGKLFREHWGEQITGNFSFGLLGFLISLPFIMLIGMGISMMSTPGFVLAGLGVLGVIGVALVQSLLASIFQAALYLYARKGHVGGGFDEHLLEHAVTTMR